jgi:hypothetical protein
MRRFEKINGAVDVPNDAGIDVTFNITSEQRAKSRYVEAQDNRAIVECSAIVARWQRQVGLIRPKDTQSRSSKLELVTGKDLVVGDATARQNFPPT